MKTKIFPWLTGLTLILTLAALRLEWAPVLRAIGTPSLAAGTDARSDRQHGLRRGPEAEAQLAKRSGDRICTDMSPDVLTVYIERESK